MRFLHLSDLHLGKKINNISLVKHEQPAILQKVLDIVQQKNIEAIILAGDIYDKTIPSEEAVKLLDWFISEIARMKLPCLIVPGNHDSAERLGYLRHLLEYQQIYIPPVFDGFLYHVDLYDEFGPITFWLLPYLRPIDVLRCYPSSGASTDYTSALRTVIDKACIDWSKRNVLAAHQFVCSGSFLPDRSMEELNLGGIDAVDVSVISRFDYVALGHIHRAQQVGNPHVRYAGSILKYSVGDANYDKSAVMVDLGALRVKNNSNSITGSRKIFKEQKVNNDALPVKNSKDSPETKYHNNAKDSYPITACTSKVDSTFELLPLRPLHDVRVIRGPLDNLVSQDVLSCSDPNDYVQVVLTDSEFRLDALEKIRTAYPNYLGIEYEFNALASDDAKVSSLPDSDEVSLEHLFESFYEMVSGETPDSFQKKLINDCLQNIVEIHQNSHGCEAT